MVVLALETVTRAGSAALAIDGACDARAGDASRTHGERLPGELLALLASHGLTPHGVDRFAIVAGPGSFTGLRVGMAAVQGLALVTNRQVSPIPTLEAMAEGWRLTRASAPGVRSVLVCLDGQRGDLFFAGWELSPDRPVESAAVVIAPSVGPAAHLVDRVRRQSWALSVVVGIGLERHAHALSDLHAPIEPPGMLLAEVAARIAARRPDLASAPHALRPLYVRRPDAVLARERAGLSGS